ncbi:MAG: LysR substrate-binding domain-containing protein, partial [Pseudomonadota bacterium]
RLGSFWAQNRDIDLRLHHSSNALGTAIDHCDIAIAWGDGKWPGLTAEYLFSISVSPVYAKSGMFRKAPIANPKDILGFPLIHQHSPQDWQHWFEKAQITIPDNLIGTTVEDANLALQATLNGQGVSLGILQFIEDEIANGQLVRPFELSVQPSSAYYLIYPDHALRSKSVTITKNWLLEQLD